MSCQANTRAQQAQLGPDWLCPRASLTKFSFLWQHSLSAWKNHAVYLVDVQAHCGGGGDADIQDERVALGLQIVAQLLAQLLPWLLQAKPAVSQGTRIRMMGSKHWGQVWSARVQMLQHRLQQECCLHGRMQRAVLSIRGPAFKARSCECMIRGQDWVVLHVKEAWTCTQRMKGKLCQVASSQRLAVSSSQWLAVTSSQK